jgi:HlyD family secretion protein
MPEGPSPFTRPVGLLVGGTDLDGAIDARLLQAFSAHGDEAAFTALVQRHGQLVLSVCRRVLGHHQDAEDAFQATFLLLARKANSIRQQASLRSWLCRVAFRVAYDARAKAMRRESHERCATEMFVTAQTDAREATNPRMLAACGPPGITALEQQELQRALREEVARLPEDLRTAVMLCHFQGHSDQEAALALGCPRGTIGSRLVRARNRLRRGLARRGHGDIASLAFPFGPSTTPPASSGTCPD